MIILGLDPGTATTGVGIIHEKSNEIRECLYVGVIKTPANLPFDDRLLIIHQHLKEIIDTYKPDHASIEEVFFSKNTKTALTVAQARGVLLLTCKIVGLEVFGYTPLQVKQGLTGYGRAEKQQVLAMVMKILKLEQEPKPDDAADALAIALTHSYAKKTKSLIEKFSV